MDYNNVNKRILELCRQRNWTEYRLSKESNISNSSINAMFKYNHTPSIHNLQKICNAFNITLSQFFNSELFSKNNTPLYMKLWNELNNESKEKVLIYMHRLLQKEIHGDDFNEIQ